MTVEGRGGRGVCSVAKAQDGLVVRISAVSEVLAGTEGVWYLLCWFDGPGCVVHGCWGAQIWRVQGCGIGYRYTSEHVSAWDVQPL